MKLATNSLFQGGLSKASAVSLLALLGLPLTSFALLVEGGFGKTEIAPTIEFFQIRGSQGATYGAVDDNSEYDFTSLGGVLKQRFGYEWFSVDLFGGATHSIAGSSTVDLHPARGYSIATTGDLRFTWMVAKDKTFAVEPILGYGWFFFSMDSLDPETAFSAMHRYKRLAIFGPRAGLFFSMWPTQHFSIRCGGLYQMPRISEKNYNRDGTIDNSKVLSARQSGALGHISFEYAWSSAISAVTSLEYAAWSASGKPSDFDNPSLTPTASYVSRLQLAWGINFTY